MDASKNGDPLMLGSMSLNSPKGFLFVPVTTAIIYALSEHICVFQSIDMICVLADLKAK